MYFSIKFYFGVAVLTAKVSFDDDDDDFRLIWFDFRRFRPFSNGFDTRRLKAIVTDLKWFRLFS